MAFHEIVDGPICRTRVNGQDTGTRSKSLWVVPPRSLVFAMPYPSALYLPLFGLVILVIVRKWKRPSLPYPPGPKGYPILGNVLDLSMSVPIWESLASLAKIYGKLKPFHSLRL